MASDSDLGPVYDSADEALKSDPQPTSKDPGETSPEIPESAQGHGELNRDEIELAESVQKQEESRASIKGLHAVTDPMWAKYREMVNSDMQAREQIDNQLQNEARTQEQQIPQQQKNDWLHAFSTLLTVAVPVALAFGIKGNGYAKGAMMSALGAAMKGFAEGRTEAAKEHMADYKRQVEAINKSNADRHKIYHDILANKKLELDDQFKLLNSVAKEFMDPYMMKASRLHDMEGPNGVSHHLENQQKIAKRFADGAKKAGKLVHKDEYDQYLIDHPGVKITYSDWVEKHSTAEDRKRAAKEEEDTKEPSSEETKAAIFD